MQPTWREMLIGSKDVFKDFYKTEFFHNVTVLTCDIVSKTLYSNAKRIYPKSIIEEAVRRCKNNVDQFMMSGMLDSESDPIKGSTVSFSKASHFVHNLHFIGNDLICDIHVLNTPQGKVLASLPPETIKFRPMGTGNGRVDSDGVFTLTSYNLITVNANQKMTE